MNVNWKRISKGGIVGTIGFLLSPLSWWNDVFVNIPIAYGVGVFANRLFHVSLLPVVIVTYWMTNVVGMVLFHRGILTLAGRESPPDPSHHRRLLVKNLIISVVYTVIIVVLIKSGVLGLPEKLFQF